MVERAQCGRHAALMRAGVITHVDMVEAKGRITLKLIRPAFTAAGTVGYAPSAPPPPTRLGYRRAHPAAVQHRPQFRRRQRLAEQPALHLGAAERAQRLALRFGLDAL